MKNILLIILISIGTNAYSQKIVGTQWYINTVIGHENDSAKLYSLTKVELTDDFPYAWGTKVVFNADGTFNCTYSAPCGNDCFPGSAGTYKRIDNSRISLTVKRITQDGECKFIDKKVNKNLGTYRISKSGDGEVMLTRVK